MTDQKLLTDLVSADLTLKGRNKLSKVSYNEEVRRLFKHYEILSYFDLIMLNKADALQLRNLAKRENLI